VSATPSQVELETLAARVGQTLLARGERLATAESCTGGWIGQAVTAVAGSSDWFDRGFITYSNDAKAEMLDVPRDILRTQGAVSEATVLAMVEGALAHSRAQWAVAVSGIAGPSGGSPAKPVGTVCFAWGGPDGLRRVSTCQFPGDREGVRARTVVQALATLLSLLETPLAA